MSFFAAIIRELTAAGVTGDALVTAIERIEGELEPKVSAAALRMRRYRERHKASQSVTGDAPPSLSPSPSSPPHPPNNPLPLSHPPSEANASAAVAAPVYADSTHELWHEGVAILVQLGLPDKSARANVGRWLRDAKSDAAKVLGAIQRARDARTRDPISFVTGALKTNIKPRGNSGFLDLALEIGEHEHSDYPKPRLIGSGG